MFKRNLNYYINRFTDKQQRAWLAYKAGKNIITPAGRRSGKSDLFTEIAIEDVEDYNKPVLYIAKTQKQARTIIWEKFDKRLRSYPDWRLNEARLEAHYKPGGMSAIVRIRGSENADDSAGSGYRMVGCDEFALWKDDSVLKRIVIPMLADYNGQLVVSSTKRGKNHFFKLHKEKERDPNWFIQEMNIWDNQFINPEGRDKLIAEYDGEDDPLYRQEIKNEYVVFQGMAFALDQESYTVPLWDKYLFDHAWHWRGVDHGFSPDPTACVFMAYNPTKSHWLIYDEYKASKLLIADHAHAIKTRHNYKFVETYSDIDPQIVAEYAAVGLPMQPAQKTSAEMRKRARILNVVNALRTGELKIANTCTQLLDEMQTYAWDDDDQEDHLIDALQYLWNNKALPVEPIKAKPSPFERRLSFSDLTIPVQDFDD